jgi:hypothetical protein
MRSVVIFSHSQKRCGIPGTALALDKHIKRRPLSLLLCLSSHIIKQQASLLLHLIIMPRLYILDVSPPLIQPYHYIQDPLRYSISLPPSDFSTSHNPNRSEKTVRFSKVVIVNDLKTVCLVQGQLPGGTKQTVNRHWLQKS